MVKIKSSKDISKIMKGDKIKVDGKEYEVDTHYVLIDHGNSKEMAIELFDSKTDKDYQFRYFNDRIEESLEFYELKEIMYERIETKKVEW
jgi:NhaP-type Na+/H+ and K+/H+ antiporter